MERESKQSVLERPTGLIRRNSPSQDFVTRAVMSVGVSSQIYACLLP